MPKYPYLEKLLKARIRDRCVQLQEKGTTCQYCTFLNDTPIIFFKKFEDLLNYLKKGIV